MEQITLGQVVNLISICGVIVGAFFGVCKWFEGVLDKKLQPMKEEVTSIKKDMRMLTKTTYNMLDHMATNNNTDNMKKLLNAFNEYNLEN